MSVHTRRCLHFQHMYAVFSSFIRAYAPPLSSLYEVFRDLRISQPNSNGMRKLHFGSLFRSLLRIPVISFRWTSKHWVAYGLAAWRMHYTTHPYEIQGAKSKEWMSTTTREKTAFVFVLAKHNLFIYVKYKNASDNKTITVAKQHWQRTEPASERARKNKRKIMERKKCCKKHRRHHKHTHAHIIWAEIENWMRWRELDSVKKKVAWLLISITKAVDDIYTRGFSSSSSYALHVTTTATYLWKIYPTTVTTMTFVLRLSLSRSS